jgi:predicted HTH domain antitoxin
MTTKTLRLPDVLAAAVHEVGSREDVEDSTAMRKLLRMGYETYLAEQYRAGRISLREIARRLDRSLSETLDALRQKGIAGNVGADDTLESLKSLGATRH